MINLDKPFVLDKNTKQKILTALSKVQIDVKGELKFNKNGEATMRLVGHIIELPLGDVNYRLLLEAVVNARKKFDFNKWNSFDCHNSAYRVQIHDNDNNPVHLTPEFYEDITEILYTNTIVY